MQLNRYFVRQESVPVAQLEGFGPASSRTLSRPWPIISVPALVALYVSLDISVGIGNARLPNLIGAVLGIILLLIHLNFTSKRVINCIFYIIYFYLLSCAIAFFRFDLPILAVFPPAQLLYTLIAAYGLFLDLSLWRRAELNRVSGIFVSAILFGSFLEVYTPFNQVTALFQQFHEQIAGVQEATLTQIRDLNQYGQLRPRLFCSETSYVAINFSIFLSVWMLTKHKINAFSFFVAIVAIIIALYIIRSPFCVIPLLVGGLIIFFGRNKKGGSLSNSTELMLFFVSILLLSLVWVLVGALFGSRIELAQNGVDWSITVRTYGALVAGWNVAMKNPLFGVGVGNFDAMREIVINTYAGFNVPAYVFNASYFESTLNNGIAANLAYFGFAGSIIHLTLWTKFLHALDAITPRLVIFGLILIIYFTTGSIYSPRGVWPLVLLLVATRAYFSSPRRLQI